MCHPITRYKQRRIIPTRMGTSLRGDGWVLERNGSSPRVWGQVSDKSTLKSVSRIIPTRMGTSLRQIHAKICVKDHPHAYGDKKLSYRFHKKGVGSSPRVWGQDDCKFSLNGDIGIIPTRMGTRARARSAPLLALDHPHAYGDKQSRTA